jgi:hypothetical protein
MSKPQLTTTAATSSRRLSPKQTGLLIAVLQHGSRVRRDFAFGEEGIFP